MTAPNIPVTAEVLISELFMLVQASIPYSTPLRGTSARRRRQLAGDDQERRNVMARVLVSDLAQHAEAAYQQGMQALMAQVFAGVGYSAADHEWPELALQLMRRLLLVRRAAALLAPPVCVPSRRLPRSTPPPAV